MIKNNKPLRIDGHGEQTRDFIHVEDVLNVNIFCMGHEGNFNGQCFDVGTGDFISIKEMKGIVDDLHSVQWDYAPPRKGDVKHTCADPSELRKLGWEARVKIKEGIRNAFILERREN
jgi:UDP-glucose 4-epimerase